MIHPPIRPRERTITMFAVVHVPSFVPRTIGPIHLPKSLHVAFSPLAAVDTAIRKLVTALTFHPVTRILALVLDTCAGAVNACPVLATHPEFAFVASTIGKQLDTATTIMVLAPLSLVAAAIGIRIRAIAMHVVTIPITVVGAAISSSELTSSMGMIFEKFSQIADTIVPLQEPIAVSDFTPPLACVSVAAFYL